MEMQEYIPIDIFCTHHGVEISFISSLKDFGLIDVMKVDEAECIPLNQLAEAERLVRLYGDLEINPEGIDVIIHLLHRIDDMQNEIRSLQNRLRLYEVN
ncbi:chaperone modulatory protein CbpM [mine drainage metagenome]|uniref:Chaperone modulatory protein CbpM n=1 Tax=mine drainage metagenome TaxID=410659 RepID=A0A1J5SBF5_9ZZZZ